MEQVLWDECVRFHGHECPGLAIGYRAAEIAKEQLGAVFSAEYNEEVVCVSENDACGVDAVQWVTGCTVGKGNMVFRPSGKMAFSFFMRDTGESIRIIKKATPKGQELSRKEFQQYILEGPVEELFDIKKPEYTLPERAKMFVNLECEQCGEVTPEHKVRLMDGKKVCSDCFTDYYRGW